MTSLWSKKSQYEIFDPVPNIIYHNRLSNVFSKTEYDISYNSWGITRLMNTCYHGALPISRGHFFFQITHDDVIKWKHFPRNWPFVREIHRSPVNFLHKGQWRGALMFTLIYAWINDWVNNREAGDLRRQHGHYDVIVMLTTYTHSSPVMERYGCRLWVRSLSPKFYVRSCCAGCNVVLYCTAIYR